MFFNRCVLKNILAQKRFRFIIVQYIVCKKKNRFNYEGNSSTQCLLKKQHYNEQVFSCKNYNSTETPIGF